jgi:hypothetical protein
MRLEITRHGHAIRARERRTLGRKHEGNGMVKQQGKIKGLKSIIAEVTENIATSRTNNSFGKGEVESPILSGSTMFPS